MAKATKSKSKATKPAPKKKSVPKKVAPKAAPAPETMFDDEDFMKIFAFLLMLNMFATSYLLLVHFGIELF